MTTTIINKNKKSNVPNKQEQNQTCLDSAEREELRPKGNVPNLRFPEFQGEWEKCTLGNNVKIQGGYAFKSELFLRKGIPIIRISNLPQNASFVDLDDCTYYKEGNYNSFEVHNGDLLIAMSGATTGKTAIYNKKTLAYLNQRVGLFKSTNSDSLYYPFLYAFVSTPVFKRQLSTRLIAGAQPNISSSDIESIRISIPQKTSEQEKIAHLMLLLDKRIATQNKIIDRLQSLIKGIAQHCIRDFTNGCEYVRLGDICKITTGKLDANAQVENGQYPFFTCAERPFYIDNYAFDTEALLISGNGANLGYINYYKGKFNAYQRTYVLDHFSVNIQYVKWALKVLLPQRIAIEKSSSNTPYIVLSTLADLKIPIPNNSKQNHIADLMMSFERKLSTQLALSDLYNKQKQYLLRQMFI